MDAWWTVRILNRFLLQEHSIYAASAMAARREAKRRWPRYMTILSVKFQGR